MVVFIPSSQNPDIRVVTGGTTRSMVLRRLVKHTKKWLESHSNNGDDYKVEGQQQAIGYARNITPSRLSSSEGLTRCLPRCRFEGDCTVTPEDASD